MRRCPNLKWIPSIDLEPANPLCSTTYHHTHLSAADAVVNTKNAPDSRSRSRVSCNTVREESCCSIIDIINEFAPSHNVEMRDHDLFPTKARSQRWPLPKKATTLSPSLWYNTKHIAQPLEEEDHVIDHTHLMMDDLWKCAAETLGIELSDNDIDDANGEKEDAPKSLCAIEPKGCGANEKTGSCSSLYFETDAELMENDEQKAKEPSISYTIYSTPSPTITIQQNHANTSKLYEFLFDSVDTDSDDDIFPTSSTTFADLKASDCKTDHKTLSNETLHQTQNEMINNGYVPCKPLSELL